MGHKTEFRCASCGRLLAKLNGDAEIKCPRCGAMNIYDAFTGNIDCIPKEECKRINRTVSSGVTFS